MLTKESKQEIIQEYQNSKDDTGSAEVQVALLSGKIKVLLLVKSIIIYLHTYLLKQFVLSIF